MERLSAYYGELFGLNEAVSLRSELFRGLVAGDLILGYSHERAAALLELPEAVGRPGQQFVTFEVDNDDAVASTTETAVASGGVLVQAPHRTYYGAQQSVLLDPEGNPFRINHLDIDEVAGS